MLLPRHHTPTRVLTTSSFPLETSSHSIKLSSPCPSRRKESSVLESKTMRSRSVASVAFRTYRAFSFAPSRHFAASTGRTADPSFFSDDQPLQPAVPQFDAEETQDHYEPDSQKPDRKPVKESAPLKPPRKMPVSPHRLENVQEVSCTGLDGSPWPKEERNDNKGEVESDKDYYSHHKASPLSELEFADTRKPITRATDGTAYSGGGGGDESFIVWRPEQLDTAEEALERARRIFRENAMRGDPESPHGRVLRQLRGEWF